MNYHKKITLFLFALVLLTNFVLAEGYDIDMQVHARVVHATNCVTPTSTTIITEDTTLCTGDYYDTPIIVDGSNIILDCNGAVISDINPAINGAIIILGNAVTIKNCILKNSLSGIFADDSSQNIFLNNTLSENINGIVDCGGSNLVNNSIYNNYNGVLICGSGNRNVNFNNFLGNSNNIEVSSGVSSNTNAKYNYWGTINKTEISNSIKNFGTGAVSFIPFLCEQYPTSVFSNKMGMCPSKTTILDYFKGVYVNRAVSLSWKTSAEVDTKGFNIYASVDQQRYVKINQRVILSKGNPYYGAKYSFKDNLRWLPNFKPTHFYYKLEEVKKAGESTFYGPFIVTRVK